MGLVDDGGFLFRTVEGRPAQLVDLYPVAFSADGDRALTFVDLTCGPLECGAALVVLLRRNGFDWVLESQVVIGES